MVVMLVMVVMVVMAEEVEREEMLVPLVPLVMMVLMVLLKSARGLQIKNNTSHVVILHALVLQVGMIKSAKILDHVVEECGISVEIRIGQDIVKGLRKLKYLAEEVALVVMVEEVEQVAKVAEVEMVEEVALAEEVAKVEEVVMVETVEMEKDGVVQ